MTLDAWLSRVPSPAPAQLPPAAKRQRLNRTSPEPTKSSSPCRPRSRATQAPPPKFGRAEASAMPREAWPPEYLLGRRSLQPWYSSRGFYDPAYPYSLACLPDSPHCVIGLETGDMHVVQCGVSELGLYDPAVGRATTVLQSPSVYKSPVRDVAALGSGRLLCTSDSGIHRIDLNHGAASELVGSFLDVTNVGIHASAGNVIAFGTSSGSVGIVDLRERVPSVVREWPDAHAVVAGPRAQRVRHAITAVSFCTETVVATASNANECVKFWDVRATSRKQPVHATAPRSSARAGASGQGGIIALAGSVTDPGTALWALHRSGELLKLSANSYHPEYRLSVPKTRVNSLYASLDLIPDGSANQVKTGHRGPGWPLIACGGQNGVTLVTEPSHTSATLDVDAVMASRLPCCENSDVTKVRWHPYANELVTISEDSACRLWALRSGRRVPSQFLPDNDSSAAHQPRLTKVAMAAIAI